MTWPIASWCCRWLPCCLRRLQCPRRRVALEAVPLSSCSDGCVRYDPPDRGIHCEMFHYLQVMERKILTFRQQQQGSSLSQCLNTKVKLLSVQMIVFRLTHQITILPFSKTTKKKTIYNLNVETYQCSFHPDSMCRDCCNGCWNYAK